MMLPQDVDLLWARLVWPSYLVRVYIERMFLVSIVGRNFFRISGRLIGPRFSVDDSVIGPSVFRQSRLMDYFTFYGLLYLFCFLCFCFPRLAICPIAGSVFTAVFCCRSLLLFSAVFSAVVVCCCFFDAVSITSNAFWSCRTVHQTNFQTGFPYSIFVGRPFSWIWSVYLFH